MKTQLTLAALAVALLIAGWLAGGAGNVAEAQNQDTGGEWRMFGSNVAGTGGSGGSGEGLLRGQVGDPVFGRTWLYNTRTGKVYRIYSGACGNTADGQNGCMTSIPVWSADRLGDNLPRPNTDDMPGFER